MRDSEEKRARGCKELVNLVHTFCRYHVDNNLWLIMNIHEHAKACAANEDVDYHLEMIKALLQQSKRREYDVNVLNCDESVIRHWMHESQMPSLDTSEVTPILTEEGGQYLSLLKDTFMLRQNDRCLRVLVYLLNLKRSRIFKPKTDLKLDIIKVCFHLLFEWCEGNQECRDFVGYASDLFFYQVQKKTMKERLPVLFVSFIVGFNGKVSCEPLDVTACAANACATKMSYLFTYIEADHDIIEEINACKARKSEETLTATRRLCIKGGAKCIDKAVKVRKCL